MGSREIDHTAWSVRAFGSAAADVERRIHPRAPAASIDALLESCLADEEGHAPLPGVVSSWSVARRLDWLVAIRMAGGAATEHVVMTCAVCRAQFELEIDLARCRLAQDDGPVEFSVAHGVSRRARLPTGTDHSRWQSERTPLVLAAAGLLVDSRPDVLDDEATQALDAALAQRDPLRELSVETACPECGASARQLVNLEEQLLGAFASTQRRLLGEIETLARVFHWREADIADMPAWRRAFYLDRVSREGA